MGKRRVIDTTFNTFTNIFILGVIILGIFASIKFMDWYFDSLNATTFHYVDSYVENNIYHILFTNNKKDTMVLIDTRDFKANTLTRALDSLDSFQAELNKEKLTFNFRAKKYDCKILNPDEVEEFYKKVELVKNK